MGVAIAVENRGRTAGSVRLAVISHATTAVLTAFVQDAIVPDAATVHTDAWAAYNALSKLGIDHRARARAAMGAMTRTACRGHTRCSEI